MRQHRNQETDGRGAFLALACLLAIPILALSACAGAPRQATPVPPPVEPVWLITPDEIAQMEQEPEGEILRGPPICREPLEVTGDGPQVEFVQPGREQREVPMRFPIDIRFTPRQAPIDRGTLRVVARYQLPVVNVVKDLDITDRVRPLWGAAGILVPAFEAPRAGCYQIEIQVGDEAHRSTKLTRGLVVKKP